MREEEGGGDAKRAAGFPTVRGASCSYMSEQIQEAQILMLPRRHTAVAAHL